MFRNLQAKWKVNGWSLLLIILTFAIGGSFCGFLARKILLLTGLEKNALWVLPYILLITLLWPFCVLIISIPFGQFSFFRKYIAKIGRRMFSRTSASPIIQLAIFASGGGSNARQIIEQFAGHKSICVALVVSNTENAGVLQIASEHKIDCLLINKDLPLGGPEFLLELSKRKIDFIVLAGFLMKIPINLIQAYPRKIINIHPALLPAYGGKGMYGRHVHEAVIANLENESGISIHYVDEIYDHGEIIFQASCPIAAGDTADSLAKKILQLEHRHYAPVIEGVLKKQKTS